MLAMGVLGWVMEENGIPIAPAILGLVLGEMFEQNFMTSMIKSDGSLLGLLRAPDRRDARRPHARHVGLDDLQGRSLELHAAGAGVGALGGRRFGILLRVRVFFSPACIT